MDRDFWLGRWREGRIGFHEGRVNGFLERHADRLGGARRVFVPLCGKSEDLAFLASRGHEVVGVDLAEEAVRAFFAERGLEPEERRTDQLLELRAGGVTLLAADVLSCTRADLAGSFDGFYDRAALVALPPRMRADYVACLRELLAPGAVGLLVTFEYPQERLDGPPFSAAESDVRTLYPDARVELLGSGPVESPRAAAAGVELVERCYAMTL